MDYVHKLYYIYYYYCQIRVYIMCILFNCKYVVIAYSSYFL